MEDKQEEFTRRMLRRSSMKKDGDESTNFSSLRRKLSILKAIEDTQLHNGIEFKVNPSNQENNPKKEFERNNAGSLKNHHPSTSKYYWTPCFSMPVQPTIKKSHNFETREQFFQIMQRHEDTDLKINTGWESNVKKCINTFSEKIETRTCNLSNERENKLKKFLSPDSSDFKLPKNDLGPPKNDFGPLKNYLDPPKNDLGPPKNDLGPPKNDFIISKIDKTCRKTGFNIPNSDLIFPRPYVGRKTKTENSTNEFSLPSYVKGFNLGEINCQGPSKKRMSQIDNWRDLPEISVNTDNWRDPPEIIGKNDDWRDASEFFGKSDNWRGPSEICRKSDNWKDLSPSFIKKDNWGGASEMLRKSDNGRDPSPIFGNNPHEEITPQLFTVTYRTTPIPEKVTNSHTLDPDSDIKKSTLPCPISTPKPLGEVEQSENGSMFSITSAIKKLDEEIEDLQIRPEAENLENVMKTPKKLFPLLAIEKPSGYTPRKLFEKDIQDPENHDEVKEKDLGEIIEAKENCSPEVKSSLVKRKSNIFGFMSSKSWRPKPSMEESRKASNIDLTKKTISTSQVESSLSSITPNTPTNPEEVKNKSLIILESTIPFEVEQFLEEALGDELYNSSITYALDNTRDKTNSNLNASELMSEDKTPPGRNWIPKTPKTEPKRHSTLNRTINAYKSLSQRIKKKFRPGLKESVKQTWNPYLAISGIVDDRLQHLLQEVSIQQTLIYQASKALDYCRSMKEFQASPEQVESERLLLVANLRKQSFFQEIRTLALNSQVEGSFNEQAEITLKDISLSLKEGVLRRERQSEDFVEWFVVVISQGLTVWASQAVICPTNSPRIYFPGGLSIPKLTPDFKITLKVYSLRIQSREYNHEEKYHISKEEKYTNCPSPKKLWKRTEKPISLKSHEVKFSGIRESAFVMMGFVDFQLHDLSLTSPWPLQVVPSDSSVLHGTVDLSLTCKLHLSISHAGFLTHGDEAGGFAVWNRRWCVLEGHTLMFWNYPREEEIKNPLLIIDLMDCVSDQVNTINRTLCARPRTFVIETARRRNASDRNSIVLECRPACTIIRNLLQCDTAHDLIEWTTKLNQILSALREWNVIGESRRESEL